jgi:hypothetical protein
VTCGYRTSYDLASHSNHPRWTATHAQQLEVNAWCELSQSVPD